MKARFFIIHILVIFLFNSITVKGQGNGCTNSACYNDTLNISTGFDPLLSTYKTPLALESNWQLIATPPSSAVVAGAPVWVINPHWAWGNYPNARWLSPFQNYTYVINNFPQPINPNYEPFTFEHCFCLCQPTTVRIKFDMMADDQTEIYLNYPSILLASAITAGSTHWALANQVSVDTTILLPAGTHCLTVDVYNTGSVAMGFALDGYIAGANMLSSVCCNATGNICGTKLNDVNGDGIVNQVTDAGMSGWQIILKDNLGNPIDTVTTDTMGNYCFHDLPAGTYIVSEIQQNGWGQTYPPGSGTSVGSHVISIVPGSAVTANFGNCKKEGTICVKKVLDENCDGIINTSGGTVLSGWKILLEDTNGVVIDSGVTGVDGMVCFDHLPVGTYTVSEVLQPYWTQTFPAAGTYSVNVTMANTSTVIFANCYTAKPCDSTPDFAVQINDCMVNFTADLDPLALTGGLYQVVSTTWDFGDGSTSSVLNPLHYYLTPGTYTVCLTVTLFNGQECCRRKICKEIDINKVCEYGCEIQANISYDLNAARCEYTFTGVVTSAMLPGVSAWLWDFDDNTTGTGPTIAHQFPGPGTYNVCVTFIGSRDELCCSNRRCTTVNVHCDPCDPEHHEEQDRIKENSNDTRTPDKAVKAPERSIQQSSITLTDKNVVVLNQNVPNPFAESTVITYVIPNDFKTAQLVFMDMGGKTVKTVNINTKGHGQITVFADDLSSGVYKYVLLIDGKIIQSKSMMKR